MMHFNVWHTPMRIKMTFAFLWQSCVCGRKFCLVICCGCAQVREQDAWSRSPSRTEFWDQCNGPFRTKEYCLRTDYAPREADGEAPLDSPVWAVEINSIDPSTVTSYYFHDAVYKYQRIEEHSAFARSIPEGARTFPAAKCHGVYKWLDKQEFNRLALSGPSHQQCNGTAKGNAKSAKTSPMVAIEPIASDSVVLDDANFTRISVRLWCRNLHVAEAWRPWLHHHTILHTEGNTCYYDGLSIYCEEQRRQPLLFETLKEPNGRTRQLFPGIDDPCTLSTWRCGNQTVAVSEIMQCQLKWSYSNTTHVWKSSLWDRRVILHTID